LQHWLGRPDSPAAIKECKLLFDKYISNSEVSISEFHLVLHACTNFGGTIFSRHSSHQGNSSIMFYPGGSQSRPPIPGCIKYIFEDNGHTELAVQQQLPVGADAIDAFQHYPYFPACLYSVALGEDLEVVRLEWVMCHCARWNFSEKHVIILPLLQVSVLMPRTCYS
ncbi:hypothetical protein BKA83DRAFT_4059293, partial [Pisolithus microcarpus]